MYNENIDDEDKRQNDELYAKEKAIYIAYIEGDLTIDEIAKIFKINPKTVEIIAENYAKYILEDLSDFYVALKKRKEKELEAKKKKKEQEEKDRIAKVEQEIDEKLKESQDFLNEYLDSDMTSKEFCAIKNIAYKYFEDYQYFITNLDVKLHVKVSSRLYDEYLEEKDSKHLKKYEITDAHELLTIKEFLNSYQNSSLTKLEFLKENGVSNKYFYEMLEALNKEEPNSLLYSQITDKLSTELVNESDILIKIIQKITERIKQGVSSKNALKSRPFDIYDYYEITNIQIDTLIRHSQEKNLEDSVVTLKKFKEENKKNEMSVTLESVPKNDNNLLAFEILKKKQLPYIYGTYTKVIEKLEKKEFDEKELNIKYKEKPDSLILVEFNQKESEEYIVKKAIEKLGIKQDINDSRVR